MLAITFTRKAAAEMHQRIVEALRGASDNVAATDPHQVAIRDDARRALERDRERDWHLLDSPSRLRIMTIDGLCRYLARQLALESGLGDIPEPAEQPQPFYRQAIRNILDDLDESGPVADGLALLLDHLDNDLPRMEGLLETLLARREQWLGPVFNARGARPMLEAALQSTIAETLEDARSALAPVAGELAGLVDYAARNLARQAPDHPLCHCLGLDDLPPAAADADSVRQWRAIADLLLKKDGDWRIKVTKTNGFPTARDSVQPDRAEPSKELWGEILERCRARPGLAGHLEDIRNLPDDAFSEHQWALLDALTVVLPRLASELSVIFQQQNSCDFTEITLAALRALGDEDNPSDLGLKLDYRIQHILVDEVQDTSFLQFSLLRKLVAGWQPGDGRTLFVVGDGMQSLYGFRNANVGLFLEARRLPVNQVPLAPLDLEVNFRSDPRILDWINRVFPDVFPADEDIGRGAVPYAPAVPARTGVDNSGVSLDIFDEAAPGRLEAERVVAHIREARRQDPDGSIAILARARSHLAEITAALHRAGIHWEATDIDPLASRMPILDLLSLTRALLNPADRIAWLSILRAPWCGLDLHDLHRLATAPVEPLDGQDRFYWLPDRVADPDAWQSLSASGRAAMTRCGPILDQARRNRWRHPLRAWVEGTWLALGGPATLADDTAQTWCQQYFDLLESHTRGTQLASAELFEQAVENLYAAPARVASSGAGPPVQVMTIHKSKGLEFDTVIIPALDRGGAGNDAALLYWRERLSRRGENQLLIAPPLAPGETGNTLVEHLKREQTLKSRLEDARVLYVACTRAKKRLRLLFREPSRSPRAGSLLARLWPAIAGDLEAPAGDVVVHRHSADAGPAHQPSSPYSPPTQLTRLRPEWHNPIVTETATGETAPGGGEKRRQDDPLARHTGTVLHRTLKQVVDEGLDRWTGERIRQQRAAWRLQLRALDVDAGEETLDQLQDALVNALEDPTGRWLLDNRHQGACELALGYIDNSGSPATSVVDRTFIDNGTRWIVDYKSSAPAPGQDTESFLASEVALYQEQLAGYRELFRATGETEIRTALYFPRLPRLSVLD